MSYYADPFIKEKMAEQKKNEKKIVALIEQYKRDRKKNGRGGDLRVTLKKIKKIATSAEITEIIELLKWVCLH